MMADRRRASPEGSGRRRREPARSEYDEGTRMRSRNDRNGRTDTASLSSSSSSSYLDISRTYPRNRIGNAIRTFFTAPSERRKARRRRSKQSLAFSNSSSSSINSDLAYGTGFIRKPKLRRVRSRNGKEIDRERERYRERERERPGSERRATTDAEILAVGVGLRELARKQNQMDLRTSRDGKKSEIIPSRESRYGNDTGTSRGLAPSRVSYGSDTFDEDGWESASDEESEFSVDSKLAYGSVPQSGDLDYAVRRPQRSNSVVDPSLFGPQNSLHGYVTEPVGFGEAEWDQHSDFGQPDRFSSPRPETRSETRQESIVSGSQTSLQHVYPIPTSDPSRFDVAQNSVVAVRPESYMSSRPGPIPIQQPQPITPVSQSVYESTYATRSDSGILKKNPSSSRGKSLAEAALVGVAGAAVGAAITSERNGKRREEDDSPPRRRDGDRSETKEERRKERRDSLDREERREKRRDREKEKEKEKDEGSRKDKKRDKRRDEPREETREERHARRKEERRKDRSDDRIAKSEVSSTVSKAVDPFKYQVPDDAFPTPDFASPVGSSTHRRKESAPTVVTVEREPDFSRKRSSSIKEVSNATRSEPGRSYADKDDRDQWYRGSDVHDERRAMHDAELIYEETSHSMAPIAAGAIGAAVAAVAVEGYRESRSERRRGERRGDYDDREWRHDADREPKQDPIQEEADRAYREIVMARKIASNVIRSRTPSPDRSVVDKYNDKEEEEVIRIVTPPGMEDHKKKGLYDAPNADVQIDYVLDPRDLDSFRSPISARANSDPYFSGGVQLPKERPLLNLVRPTPAPTPTPEKQIVQPEPAEQKQSKKGKKVSRSEAGQSKQSESDNYESRSEVRQSTQPKNERFVSQSEVGQSTQSKPEKYVSRSEVGQSSSSRGRGRPETAYEPEFTIGPKGTVMQSPTASTVSKGVTWGQNETKHYEVESPSTSPVRNREIADEERPTFSSKGWGAIAAGILGAGAGAAIADSGENNPSSKVKDNGHKLTGPYEYRGVVVEPESPPRSKGRRSPPATGPKPVPEQRSHIPGAFEDDIDFTATLAAGLQDTGFDPNIVIDDPTYRRRSSPPGSNDTGIYQAPFVETVTDLGTTVESPGHEGAPPVQGFVVGEVPDTPKGERSTSTDDGFTKLSKKEQKKLEKASRRQSGEMTPLEENNTVKEIAEEAETYFEVPKLSKKEQKKRDKAAQQQNNGAEDMTPVEEPSAVTSIVEEPESYFEAPKKSKKKSKKGSSGFEDDFELSRDATPLEESTTGKVIVEEPESYFETPKKSKKKSKKSSSAFSDDIEPSRDTTPLDESVVSRSVSEEQESYFDTPKKSKKKSKKSSNTFDDVVEEPRDSQSTVAVPVDAYEDIQAGENAVATPATDEWDIPKKSKKKSKKSSSGFDDDLEQSGDGKSTVSVPVGAYNDVQDAEYSVAAPVTDEWDTPKKSKKKSKRDSDRFDSPSRSVPPSEVGSEVGRSSSKKSKDKSRRKSDQYDLDVDPTEIPLPLVTPSETGRDEYDEPRKSRRSSTRDSGIFDSTHRGVSVSQSVVSAGASRYDDDEPRKSKKKHRSGRYDDDDTKSVASAPAGDDWDDPKKTKKKEKKSGGFFGLFGSKAEPEAKEVIKDEFEEPKKRSKKSKRSSTTDLTSESYNGNGHLNGNGSHFYDDDGEGNGSRSDGEMTKKDKKESFLVKAGTLGAGVGLAGAAVAIATQHQQSKAANADLKETPEQHLSHSDLPVQQDIEESATSSPADNILDPEITQRQFRPSIDPQYGDLLPLPPSGPPSPDVVAIDDLPELPESRSPTPEAERRSARDKNSTRRSWQDSPVKSPSRSAVPLKFIMGNRSTPSSPVLVRSSPMTTAATDNSDNLASPRTRPRPTSWDSTKEYKPLYLVESNRRSSFVQQPDFEEPLPALPPSRQTSRSSSQPETEDFRKQEELVDRSIREEGPPLSIDTSLPGFLDSAQSTPKATRSLEQTSRETSDVVDLPSTKIPSTLPKDHEQALKDTTPTALRDAALVSSIGYFASVDSPKSTDKAWLGELPSPTPGSHQDSSPVDPMTKDRSSYLLHSTSPPAQSRSIDAIADDDDVFRETSKQSSDDLQFSGSQEHQDSNVIGTLETTATRGAHEITPEDAPKTLQAKSDASIVQDLKIGLASSGLDEDHQASEDFSFSKSKKDKKGKKTQKALSRSSTQDEISPAESSQDVTREDHTVVASPTVETKKSKKKKGKSTLDWEPTSELEKSSESQSLSEQPESELTIAPDPEKAPESVVLSKQPEDELVLISKPEKGHERQDVSEEIEQSSVLDCKSGMMEKEKLGLEGSEPKLEQATDLQDLPEEVLAESTSKLVKEPEASTASEGISDSPTRGSKKSKKNKKGNSTLDWEPELILEQVPDEGAAAVVPEELEEFSMPGKKKGKKNKKGKSTLDMEPESKSQSVPDSLLEANSGSHLEESLASAAAEELDEFSAPVPKKGKKKSKKAFSWENETVSAATVESTDVTPLENVASHPIDTLDKSSDYVMPALEEGKSTPEEAQTQERGGVVSEPAPESSGSTTIDRVEDESIPESLNALDDPSDFLMSGSKKNKKKSKKTQSASLTSLLASEHVPDVAESLSAGQLTDGPTSQPEESVKATTSDSKKDKKKSKKAPTWEPEEEVSEPIAPASTTETISEPVLEPQQPEPADDFVMPGSKKGKKKSKKSLQGEPKGESLDTILASDTNLTSEPISEPIPQDLGEIPQESRSDTFKETISESPAKDATASVVDDRLETTQPFTSEADQQVVSESAVDPIAHPISKQATETIISQTSNQAEASEPQVANEPDAFVLPDSQNEMKSKSPGDEPTPIVSPEIVSDNSATSTQGVENFVEEGDNMKLADVKGLDNNDFVVSGSKKGKKKSKKSQAWVPDEEVLTNATSKSVSSSKEQGESASQSESREVEPIEDWAALSSSKKGKKKSKKSQVWNDDLITPDSNELKTADPLILEENSATSSDSQPKEPETMGLIQPTPEETDSFAIPESKKSKKTKKNKGRVLEEEAEPASAVEPPNQSSTVETQSAENLDDTSAPEQLLVGKSGDESELLTEAVKAMPESMLEQPSTPKSNNKGKKKSKTSTSWEEEELPEKVSLSSDSELETANFSEPSSIVEDIENSAPKSKKNKKKSNQFETWEDGDADASNSGQSSTEKNNDEQDVSRQSSDIEPEPLSYPKSKKAKKKSKLSQSWTVDDFSAPEKVSTPRDIDESENAGQSENHDPEPFASKTSKKGKKKSKSSQSWEDEGVEVPKQSQAETSLEETSTSQSLTEIERDESESNMPGSKKSKKSKKAQSLEPESTPEPSWDDIEAMTSGVSKSVEADDPSSSNIIAAEDSSSSTSKKGKKKSRKSQSWNPEDEVVIDPELDPLQQQSVAEPENTTSSPASPASRPTPMGGPGAWPATPVTPSILANIPQAEESTADYFPSVGSPTPQKTEEAQNKGYLQPSVTALSVAAAGVADVGDSTIKEVFQDKGGNSLDEESTLPKSDVVIQEPSTSEIASKQSEIDGLKVGYNEEQLRLAKQMQEEFSAGSKKSKKDKKKRQSSLPPASEMEDSRSRQIDELIHVPSRARSLSKDPQIRNEDPETISTTEARKPLYSEEQLELARQLKAEQEESGGKKSKRDKKKGSGVSRSATQDVHVHSFTEDTNTSTAEVLEGTSTPNLEEHVPKGDGLTAGYQEDQLSLARQLQAEFGSGAKKSKKDKKRRSASQTPIDEAESRNDYFEELQQLPTEESEVAPRIGPDGLASGYKEDQLELARQLKEEFGSSTKKSKKDKKRRSTSQTPTNDQGARDGYFDEVPQPSAGSSELDVQSIIEKETPDGLAAGYKEDQLELARQLKEEFGSGSKKSKKDKKRQSLLRSATDESFSSDNPSRELDHQHDASTEPSDFVGPAEPVIVEPEDEFALSTKKSKKGKKRQSQLQTATEDSFAPENVATASEVIPNIESTDAATETPLTDPVDEAMPSAKMSKKEKKRQSLQRSATETEVSDSFGNDASIIPEQPTEELGRSTTATEDDFTFTGKKSKKEKKRQSILRTTTEDELSSESLAKGDAQLSQSVILPETEGSPEANAVPDDEFAFVPKKSKKDKKKQKGPVAREDTQEELGTGDSPAQLSIAEASAVEPAQEPEAVDDFGFTSKKAKKDKKKQKGFATQDDSQDQLSTSNSPTQPSTPIETTQESGSLDDVGSTSKKSKKEKKRQSLLQSSKPHELSEEALKEIVPVEETATGQYPTEATTASAPVIPIPDDLKHISEVSIKKSEDEQKIESLHEPLSSDFLPEQTSKDLDTQEEQPVIQIPNVPATENPIISVADEPDDAFEFSTKKSKKDKKKRQSLLQSSTSDALTKEAVEKVDPQVEIDVQDSNQTPTGTGPILAGTDEPEDTFEPSTKKSKKDKKKRQSLLTSGTINESTNIVSEGIFAEPESIETANLGETRDSSISLGAQPVLGNTDSIADSSESPFGDVTAKKSKKDKKNRKDSSKTEPVEATPISTATAEAIPKSFEDDQSSTGLARKTSKKEKKKRQMTTDITPTEISTLSEPASTSWADEVEAADEAKRPSADEDVTSDPNSAQLPIDNVNPPVDDSFRPTKKGKKGKKNDNPARTPVTTAGVIAVPTQTESPKGLDDIIPPSTELPQKSTEPEEHMNRSVLAAAGAAFTASALTEAKDEIADKSTQEKLSGSKVANKEVDAPVAKKLSKKEKRKKSIDKRAPSEDDIFDDPMLWEGAEPTPHEEIQDADDGDDGSDGFWSAPIAEDAVTQSETVEKASLSEHSAVPQEDSTTHEPIVKDTPHATLSSASIPSSGPEVSSMGKDIVDTATDHDFPSTSKNYPTDEFLVSSKKDKKKKKQNRVAEVYTPAEHEESTAAEHGLPSTTDEIIISSEETNKKKQNRSAELYTPPEPEHPAKAERDPTSTPEKNDEFIVSSKKDKKQNRLAELYTPEPIKSTETQSSVEQSAVDRDILFEESPIEHTPIRPLSSNKFRRSLSTGLPVLKEEIEAETRLPESTQHGTPDANRDSAFVTGSPIPPQGGFSDSHEHVRDSGVHLRDDSPASHGRGGLVSSDDALARLSWPPVNEDSETVDLTRQRVRRSREAKPHGESSDLMRHQELPRAEGSQRGISPARPKTDKYGDIKSAKPLADRIKLFNDNAIGAGTVAAGIAAVRSHQSRDLHGLPSPSPSPGAGPRASSVSAQRQRSSSNINRLRTPDPKIVRPESVGSNRSSASATPPLRRTARKLSGDLRSLSQRSTSNLDLAKESKESKEADRVAIASSTSTSDVNVNVNAIVNAPSPNPTANEGRVRAKDMADVYDGFGEGRLGSPRSPTRPHSMRRRQSMQVLDLETRVEQLSAENRMLAEAKAQAEHTLQTTQHAASALADRDAEIDSLKSSLDWLHREVNRLTEVNEGLTSASVTLGHQHNDRYGQLEAQHAQATRELRDVRAAHDNLSAGMQGIIQSEVRKTVLEKDREIAQLRSELEAAKGRIRAMQREILLSKANNSEFLTVRDEDYFDTACQQLCQHVQQWVLRFSKFSDMRACRLTSEINNDKIIDRLDNAILDGSDVDSYLADRVKRRDVFMSMTMTMVWEFVFTRYLFGMDREQRQKLKSLEKLLSEVGPPAAVHQWRATTLTLLAKREAFLKQREQDTEAVVHEILNTLFEILPPPSQLEDQIGDQLRRVMKAAVDLSIEMRTQRAEYMMLPPLQPEYDANGDLASKVSFNAALMNERSGDTVSNEELEAQKAVVRVVLFPLVVKKGDDKGEGDEEIVVCPAQVLVAKPKKSVRIFSGDGSVGNRSRVSMQSTMPDVMEGSI